LSTLIEAHVPLFFSVGNVRTVGLQPSFQGHAAATMLCLCVSA
jgi:hypothetical protein